MSREKLLDSLARYGYPLVSPAPAGSPEEVLRNLASHREARLLEGFPVVLAGALKEKTTLEWERPRWMPARRLSKAEEKRLCVLLALSYLLFRLYGLDQNTQTRTLRLLKKFRRGQSCVKALETPFLKSESVRVGKTVLSTGALKTKFRNYTLQAETLGALAEKSRELELELLLSELFAPKQKELLRKRLEDKPMTKTEREYFYRVVKKKLRALADPSLHEMAKRLMCS